MSSLRKLIAGLALAFVFAASPALAANCGTGGPTGVCYKRAGTGDWSTVGTWSNTSGGVSSGTIPASGDHIILDANSGDLNFSGGSPGSPLTIGSLDLNGFTGSVNWAYVTTVINGNDSTAPGGVTIRLPSGLTPGWDQFMPFQLTATSGTVTVTSNNVPFWSLEIGVGGSSSATFTLGSDFQSIASAGVTHTSGTFTISSYYFKTGVFNSDNTNTRTINWASGTVHTGTLTGTVGFGPFNTSGLTWNRGTATFKFDTGGYYYSANNLDLYNVVIGTNDGLAIEGGCFYYYGPTAVTWQSVTLEPGACLQGQWNLDITVTGNFTSNCTSALPCLINSAVNTPIADGGMMFVVGGTATASWTAFRNIAFTGGTALTATNSLDFGGNFNATITPPSTGGGGGAPCIGC
jgi:hypothetical protein